MKIGVGLLPQREQAQHRVESRAMVRLPKMRMRRRPPTRRTVVLAVSVGLALCLLAILNGTLHPHEAVSVPLLKDVVFGTPSLPSAASVAKLIEHDVNAVSTSLATPIVAVTATPTPTISVTPLPTNTPFPMPTKSPVPTSPAVTETTEPTTVATVRPQAPIKRLTIPDIGVDASVEVKTVDSDGVMQAPNSSSVVAWYDFSAQPGTNGNAVFAGHLDYAGVGPAVFWRLDQLEPGDEINITDGDGKSFRYRVTSVRSYSATADASQIVASVGKPTITLITCNGTFDRSKSEYDQRIVVTGTLID
jgi:LPXTG-site transpeptidase (sortase) family protein